MSSARSPLNASNTSNQLTLPSPEPSSRDRRPDGEDNRQVRLSSLCMESLFSPRCVQRTVQGSTGGTRWQDAVFMGAVHGASTFLCKSPFIPRLFLPAFVWAQVVRQGSTGVESPSPLTGERPLPP